MSNLVQFILDNFDTIFRDEKSFETFDKMILDLAVRGKLVPQIEEEEPASKLLQRIKEEKERLVAEKVIKKEKPLSPITEDEKPFHIPSSWEWVRLGEIVDVINGFAYKSQEYVKSSKYQLIRLGNVKNNFLKLDSNPVFIDNKIAIQTFSQKIFENDLLISLTGTRGKRDYFYSVLIKKEFLKNKELYLNQRVGCIRGIKDVNSNFLNIIIKAEYLLNLIFDTETGTANQGNIGTENVKKLLLPLPPLKEQERIVEKVEKLQELSKKFKEIYNSNEKTRANLKKSILEEVEKSDTNNELLISLEKLFGNFEKVIKTKEDVKDIRNLVLSLAVRGKLVPQIEDEEPASKLLQRIKEEKERLIAEKIIKKEKPLPPIIEDEKPYDIPSSWELERLGNISNILRGSSPRPKGDPRYFTDERTPYHWITIWDITNKSLDNNLIDTREFLTEEGSKKSTYCEKGEIIIAVSGSVGKSSILNINGYIYDGLAVLKKISNDFNQEYIYLFLKYFVDKINSMATGTAFPNINTEILKNIILPVPPLEEQERIVKRVDELMAVCDTLESKIETSEKINQKLLASLLKK